MSNFLVIEYELLANRNLQSADKLIIAFLRAYEKAGRFYFGSEQYMASLIGVELGFLKSRLEALKRVGIICQSQSDLRLLVDLDQLRTFQVNKKNMSAVATAMSAIANVN
jgi:hypothetical protein